MTFLDRKSAPGIFAPTSPKIIDWQGCSPAGPPTKREFLLNLSGLLSDFDESKNTSMLEEMGFVPDVTIAPSAIFEGLMRSGQDEALCYTGIPSGEFMRNNGMEVPPLKDGLTFMVFLTRNLEVTKWRFCRADATRKGVPADHVPRFRRMVWPTD